MLSSYLGTLVQGSAEKLLALQILPQIIRCFKGLFLVKNFLLAPNILITAKSNINLVYDS